MRKLILLLSLFIAILSFQQNSYCDEYLSDITMTSRVDFRRTLNNDADNSCGINVRIEKPVWREFSLGIEGEYMGRQYFPCNYDPKGAIGSMFGYGLLGEIIFRPVVTDQITPYVFGGIGPYWWDFKENPYLQDNKITIKVGPSIATKVGSGVDYWINDRWALNFEMSYFHSNVPKKAIGSDGQNLSILGDDKIGNQEIRIGGGLRYRF